MIRVNEVIVSRIAGRNTSPAMSSRTCTGTRVVLPPCPSGCMSSAPMPAACAADGARRAQRQAERRREPEDQPPRHRPTALRIASPNCASPAVAAGQRPVELAEQRHRGRADPDHQLPSPDLDHQEPLARAQRQRAHDRAIARTADCRARRASGASPRCPPQHQHDDPEGQRQRVQADRRHTARCGSPLAAGHGKAAGQRPRVIRRSGSETDVLDECPVWTSRSQLGEAVGPQHARKHFVEVA